MWDWLVVIARTITYAATFGAAGGAFFLVHNRRVLADVELRHIRRLIGGSSGVACAASLAKILFIAGSLGGDASGMLDIGLHRMVLQAGEGRAVAARLLGLALLVWGTRPSKLTAMPAMTATPLGGGALAATSFGWVGHVHALGLPVAELLLVVHLLCVAWWLGALGPLVIVSHGLDVARVAVVVSRFGALALRIVGALLLAGAVLLTMLLRGVSDLWHSDYGLLVIGKLVLVALLLTPAAFNHLRLTPRLLAGDPGAALTLRRSVSIELALGCSILSVTAALTTFVGPPG